MSFKNTLEQRLFAEGLHKPLTSSLVDGIINGNYLVKSFLPMIIPPGNGSSAGLKWSAAGDGTFTILPLLVASARTLTNGVSTIDITGLGIAANALNNQKLVSADGTTLYGQVNTNTATTITLTAAFSGVTGTYDLHKSLELPNAFCSGYMYFPINQIAGKSNAAGLYYIEMTTTTAGKVYNNIYDTTIGGEATVPSIKVPFSGITADTWLTQSTSQVVLWNYILPAGTVGPTGELSFEPSYMVNQTAEEVLLFGSTYAINRARTTYVTDTALVFINNIGSESMQSIRHGGTYTYGALATYNGIAFGTQNTAVDTNIQYKCGLNGTNTSYVILFPGKIRLSK